MAPNFHRIPLPFFNLLIIVLTSPLFPEIPHVKIGPEETPKLPYLRFASVTLYPSNEDMSLAIGSILHSFGYPTASLICAKAECESVGGVCVYVISSISIFPFISSFPWLQYHIVHI